MAHNAGWTRWLALVGALAGTACGGGSSARDAGGVVDAGPQPGPSPGVCTPVAGQTGNSLHVGAYCTHNGNQCAQYAVDGGFLACAIDLDPTQGADFCILLGCQENGACGIGGCCAGSSLGSACVPLGCLATDAGLCPPPFDADAGADGG